jgi:hypothetical protein
MVLAEMILMRGVKKHSTQKKREGGLVSIQKFNAGGLSKVPNKVTHDENDVNNYMRINGYMED